MDNNKYLIIGGSTKCGTTSVFHYLEFHPDVCPCMMKESRFFWTNDYPVEAAGRNTEKYNSFGTLFPKCANKKIRIEATPDYLYSSASALKIKSELADVKIVFILRDPVERLLSWYKFAKLNGLIEKDLALEKYIEIQINNTSENLPQHLRSLDQGKYFQYIRNYVELFGKSRVLISFYEDLSSDPLKYCQLLSEFAEINPDYFSGYDFKIFNKSVATRSVGAHKLFRKFKRTIRPVTRMLNDSLRKKLKLAGYNLEKAYISANTNEDQEKNIMDDTTLLALKKYYSADVDQLKSFIGKNPPWRNFDNP